MFNARLDEAELLQKVLEAVSVKGLIKEASWNCSESGVQIQAKDSSGGVIVSLFLPSNLFKDYSCDQPLLLGMNIDTMSKILKSADVTDGITIKAADSPDSVTIIHAYMEGCGSYEMKLMDTETIELPEMTSSCTIEMDSKVFQKLGHDLSQIGESMSIDCSAEKAKFSSSGDSCTGDIVMIPWGNPGEDVVTIKMQEACTRTGTFDLKLFNFCEDMAKPLYGSVTLSLSSDGPLDIDYKLTTRWIDHHIHYYLIPK